MLEIRDKPVLYTAAQSLLLCIVLLFKNQFINKEIAVRHTTCHSKFMLQRALV